VVYLSKRKVTQTATTNYLKRLGEGEQVRLKGREEHSREENKQTKYEADLLTLVKYLLKLARTGFLLIKW